MIKINDQGHKNLNILEQIYNFPKTEFLETLTKKAQEIKNKTYIQQLENIINQEDYSYRIQKHLTPNLLAIQILFYNHSPKTVKEISQILEHKFQDSSFAKDYLLTKRILNEKQWYDKITEDIKKNSYESVYIKVAPTLMKFKTHNFYDNFYYSYELDLEVFSKHENKNLASKILNQMLYETIVDVSKTEPKYEIPNNSELKKILPLRYIKYLTHKFHDSNWEKFLTKINEHEDEDSQEYIDELGDLSYFLDKNENQDYFQELEIFYLDPSFENVQDLNCILSTNFKASDYADDYINNNNIYDGMCLYDELDEDLRQNGAETHYQNYFNNIFNIADKDTYYHFERENNQAENLRELDIKELQLLISNQMIKDKFKHLFF
ncbi:hypothetical protein [Mycoplasma sp. 3686d]|uniref:hypothetical protein n=1 Tax=Mycoplasma sp. 3686d TaxID=2967300 RepID=UPI00211BE5D7|nr:hypothetical protein [Mycoplasma sp. 3686d]UUM24536.1 hypothetical protein NPA12_02440 [Mycoplasma sp. 3686d]